MGSEEVVSRSTDESGARTIFLDCQSRSDRPREQLLTPATIADFDFLRGDFIVEGRRKKQ
ncbi:MULTISPECIES: hypothetical protein [unclassified Microcoleus]|uniref:hypothetical protein n=1 Tax=unclassified Microcoleus TaxID=2642155 RepID=UPI002FD13484